MHLMAETCEDQSSVTVQEEEEEEEEETAEDCRGKRK